MNVTAKSGLSGSDPLEPMAAPPQREHFGYLDSLRALAALYVVWNHGFSTHAEDGATPRAVRLLGLFLQHGHSAVNLFIVLSGFCLMLPVVRGDGVLRGGAMHFFKKRARRILPPYFCALGLSLILIWLLLGQKTGTLWDKSIPVTTAGLVSHLLLVQDAFVGTRSDIDHPLWSVSVEWRIYFAFPLLVLAWKRFGPFVTALSTVAFSVLLLLVLKHTPINTGVPGVSPQYLGLFAMGMLAAGIVFSSDVRLRSLRERLPWMPLSLVLFLCVVGVTKSGAVPTDLADYVVGLWALSVLVVASDGRHGRLHRALSWKPLVYVGTFAYSIYLIHAPLLQVFWQYGLHPLHLSRISELVAICLIGTPLIVGVSYLFFLACERPFLNTRRRETMAQTAEDAALSPAP